MKESEKALGWDMRRDCLMVDGAARSLPQGWVCMGCLTCPCSGGTSKNCRALGSRVGTQKLEPGVAGSRPSSITRLTISHVVPSLHCSHLVYGLSYPVPHNLSENQRTQSCQSLWIQGVDLKARWSLLLRFSWRKTWALLTSLCVYKYEGGDIYESCKWE